MTLPRQRLLAAATVGIAAPVILHWRYPKLVNSQLPDADRAGDTRGSRSGIERDRIRPLLCATSPVKVAPEQRVCVADRQNRRAGTDIAVAAGS